MLPNLPPELDNLDDELKEYVRNNLELIYKDKVKNGLYLKRLLLHTDQAGYTRAVQVLANMWSNKSALAQKSFEIEGEIILELVKVIFSTKYIETSLEISLEASLYIRQLQLTFGDNPHAMRLINNALNEVERAQKEGTNRVLRLINGGR